MQGNADAQAALDGRLHCGEDGPQDLAEARRLYGLAAAQGQIEARAVLTPTDPSPAADLGTAARPAASEPVALLIGDGVATSPVPVAIGASGWGRGGRGLGGRGGQRVQSAAAIATDDAVGAVAHLLGQASLQVPAGSSVAGAAASDAAAAPEVVGMPPLPPAAVTSLADAQLSTGRLQPPESTKEGRKVGRKTRTRIGGQSTCIICFTNPKSHLAVPCGHQCACGDCSARMQECPVCHSPVREWIHVRVA